MKLFTIIHYQVHVTLITFQGHGFKGRGHRQHIPKLHFSARGILINNLPSNTI